MGTYDPAPADGARGWGAWLRAVVASLDARLLAAEVPTLNTQGGAAYTLALADTARIVEMTSSAANTITVPPNLSVAFPVGCSVQVRQMGTGLTTVQAGSGVTIRSRGGALQLGGQYAEALLTQRAGNEWVLSGDIT